MAKELTELETLELHACRGITKATVSTIAARSRLLSVLDLSCCPLEMAVDLASLAASSCVTDLRVGGCTRLHERALRHAPRGLTALDVAAVGLDDAVAATVAGRCPRLETLRLAGCPGLTGAGLVEAFRGHPALHTVDATDAPRILPADLR